MVLRQLVAATLSALATGCFSPDYPTGQACSKTMGCPDGQFCEPTGICEAPGPANDGDAMIVPVIPATLEVAGGELLVGGQGASGLEFYAIDSTGPTSQPFAVLSTDGYESSVRMASNGTDLVAVWATATDLWFGRFDRQGGVQQASKMLLATGEVNGWSLTPQATGYGLAWSSAPKTATQYVELDDLGTVATGPVVLAPETSDNGLMELRHTGAGEDLVVRAGGPVELLRLGPNGSLKARTDLGLHAFDGDVAVDGDQLLLALSDTYEGVNNDLVLARVSADATVVEKTVPIPTHGAIRYAHCDWTGSELGVAFMLERTDDPTNPELWFARFDKDLKMLGEPVMVANRDLILQEMRWVPDLKAYALLWSRAEDSAVRLIPVN